MNTSKPSKKTSTRFATTALFLLASLGSGSAALAETPERRGLTVTIASEIGTGQATPFRASRQGGTRTRGSARRKRAVMGCASVAGLAGVHRRAPRPWLAQGGCPAVHASH